MSICARYRLFFTPKIFSFPLKTYSDFSVFFNVELACIFRSAFETLDSGKHYVFVVFRFLYLYVTYFLQTTGGKFHEPFYVLVVEKTDDDGAMMHVWRLVLASEGEGFAGEYKLCFCDIIPIVPSQIWSYLILASWFGLRLETIFQNPKNVLTR